MSPELSQKLAAAVDGMPAFPKSVQAYPSKPGWGHGTFPSNIDYAGRIGAKGLYGTHREPTRSDDAREATSRWALADHPMPSGSSEVWLASEGHVYEF